MAVDETRFGADGSYEIRADETTNTLYLTFQGSLPRTTVSEAVEQALAAAADLTDGFRVITDVSAFGPISTYAAEPIEAAQRRLRRMGVSEVVEVVGDDTSPVLEDAFERHWQNGHPESRRAATVGAAERELGI